MVKAYIDKKTGLVEGLKEQNEKKIAEKQSTGTRILFA